jgi:hypothetical protein
MRRGRARLIIAAALAALCAASSGCGGSHTTSSSAPGAGATSSATTTTTPTSSTGVSTTGSGAAPRGGPTALTVSPTSGTPHSVIRVRFTSPETGARAGTRISQALSVLGPRHAGCVGMHDEAVPVAPAGQAVVVAVGPAQLGGVWCPGAYSARVEVLARPKCGQGMMCPQFIRVVAVLGPVTFRIAG